MNHRTDRENDETFTPEKVPTLSNLSDEDHNQLRKTTCASCGNISFESDMVEGTNDRHYCNQNCWADEENTKKED